MRLRLYAWYLVCASLLAGHAVWFVALRAADHSRSVLFAGYGALGALTVALAVLLITTPPDAIRLPRPRSERLIAAGAVGLYVCAMLVASPASASVRVVGAACVALAGTLVILRIVRWTGASAWVAALFGWNPVVVYETAVAGRVGLTMAALAALVAAVVVSSRISPAGKKQVPVIPRNSEGSRGEAASLRRDSSE